MSDEHKIYEHAEIAFQKLKPNAGDVVVITFPPDIEPAQMQLFGEQLQPMIPEDVTILCTRSSVTVENFSEALMNKAGWYRFDTKTVN